MRSLSIVGLVLLTSACAVDATGTDDETSTTTQYMNAGDFDGGFYDIRSKLDGAFAASNQAGLTSLGLDCSVTSKIGNLHDCVWTFAGEAHTVDPMTAAISTSQPWYECHVSPKTTLAKFDAQMSASTDPLHETLPGTTTTFDDVLADCFAHPKDETGIVITTNINPTYVEATDYYKSDAYKAQWAKATAALKQGFDWVCGDTFCGGDYGNMQSLAFVCSVTRSSGNIKECAWLFTGSYAMPTKTGAMPVNEKSWRCEVPVKGTVSQLMGVVNATSTTDVLHRPLPNGTATAYDALLNCL
jgi:hypothetical protein